MQNVCLCVQKQSQEGLKQTVNTDFVSRRKTKENFLACFGMFLFFKKVPEPHSPVCVYSF